MIETVKRYKELIGIALFVLGGGWWLKGLDARGSDAAKKIDRLEQAVLTLSEIVKHDNAKLEGFLTAMGIDPEKARTWSRMSKVPPADSSGKPIIGAPWVRLSPDLDLGERVMLGDSGHVYVDTLWSFGKPKR